MMIEYRGQMFRISDEAHDALCECGPEVGDGSITSEQATHNILIAEGFTSITPPQ